MRFIIVILSFSFLGFAFPKHTIRHDQHEKLTWTDFKAKADRSSSYYANTSSGFEFEVEMKGDSLQMFLPCYFYEKQSWVKKGEGTPELLAHEQLHFDITELHIRKMRKALRELGSADLKKFNQQSAKIIKQFSKESSKVQKLYDKETNHSINAQKQREWEAQIGAEMEIWAKYSDPNIILPVR